MPSQAAIDLQTIRELIEDHRNIEQHGEHPSDPVELARYAFIEKLVTLGELVIEDTLNNEKPLSVEAFEALLSGLRKERIGMLTAQISQIDSNLVAVKADVERLRNEASDLV
jgi:hypothetical protein